MNYHMYLAITKTRAYTCQHGSSHCLLQYFILILIIIMLSYSTISPAAEYSLAIQPILPQVELKKRFQPLADYLSQEIGQRVATMPSPSLGILRLEELFPNPVHTPVYIWKRNTSVAVEKILSEKIDTAIIPTRLASTYSKLNTQS